MKKAVRQVVERHKKKRTVSCNMGVWKGSAHLSVFYKVENICPMSRPDTNYANYPNYQKLQEETMVKISSLPSSLRKEGISRKLENICNTYDVVKLAIFGSFVKNLHHRKSDVDIAVEFDSSKPKDLLDLVRLERKLRGIFRKKVDLGIISSINPHVRKEILKEMRFVYEKR